MLFPAVMRSTTLRRLHGQSSAPLLGLPRQATSVQATAWLGGRMFTRSYPRHPIYGAATRSVHLIHSETVPDQMFSEWVVESV
jgi:hypothetical protein